MWTNRWMDRQTDEKRTNERTEFHQFRKEPSYDGELELESRNEYVDKQTDGQTNGTKNGQTNGRNFTNIERNLAMMLIYVPVKFEFDRTNRF